MKRVLVTGGAGFIGSWTVAELRSHDVDVVVIDDLSSGHRSNLDPAVRFVEASIEDADAVRDAVSGCSHVVHLAARPSVPGSCEDPVAYDGVNVHGAVTVFEAARRAGVQRVVYASSSAVYGASEVLPKREDQPLAPTSPYAAAKAADELYGAVYSETLGLSCVGLRYFNVFGPRQDPAGPYAAVIPKFVERALAGRPLLVFGDGEQSRDFVSVKDVARANVLALTVPASGVYNIGGGRGTTVNQLARAVCDGVADVGIEHREERAGDVRHSVADISRAIRMGWAPQEDFAAAMAETVEYYRRLSSSE